MNGEKVASFIDRQCFPSLRTRPVLPLFFLWIIRESLRLLVGSSLSGGLIDMMIRTREGRVK